MKFKPTEMKKEPILVRDKDDERQVLVVTDYDGDASDFTPKEGFYATAGYTRLRVSDARRGVPLPDIGRDRTPGESAYLAAARQKGLGTPWVDLPPEDRHDWELLGNAVVEDYERGHPKG